MNYNGRPLSAKKKVQILVAFTLLAWATQTLFSQWAKGQNVQEAAAFVPRDSVAGGTLELRAEAHVQGADVKLRNVCRWSESDAAMFAPVADVVLAKLESRRPYQIIDVRDVRKILEEARINVATVRFSGPTQCTVSRTDTELRQGDALEQWINAKENKPTEDTSEKSLKTGTIRAPDASPRAKAAAAENDRAPRTLRDLLTADLCQRLSLAPADLVLSFDPRDEAAVNLSEAQFKFNVQARRAKELGDVAWEVAIAGPGGSKSVQIRGSARAWQNQVVAVRSLGREQLIRGSDVIQRRTLVDRTPDDLPLTPEQVVGQMAERDIKPGMVMTAPLVEAVPLAKVGQFITITLDRGSVRIKSVAKALEGGCYGQTIRVKNEATRDVYQVVLTGPQEASMAPPSVASAKN